MNPSHPSRPPRPRPAPAAPPAVGEAQVSHVAAKPTRRPAEADGLKLPHDRDESVGQAGHEPEPKIEQARRDLASGKVDTDMRASPGLDAERRQALVPTAAPSAGPRRPGGGRRKPAG